MRRNIAFSIVELLVVIGIVSVIAAMLLPSLEQSLMAARTARCAGNLRQQGNAFSMYATEHSGAWPWRDEQDPSYWFYNFATYTDSRPLISPYLEFGELTTCPGSGCTAVDGEYRIHRAQPQRALEACLPTQGD